MPEQRTGKTGIGSPPPARSALTRIVLATFGLVIFLFAAVASILLDVPYGVSLTFAAFTAVALVNLLVVANRKHRGEPGWYVSGTVATVRDHRHGPSVQWLSSRRRRDPLLRTSPGRHVRTHVRAMRHDRWEGA